MVSFLRHVEAEKESYVVMRPKCDDLLLVTH